MKKTSKQEEEKKKKSFCSETDAGEKEKGERECVQSTCDHTKRRTRARRLRQSTKHGGGRDP